MKGLSVIFTILLLVLAHRLAAFMKQTGNLPAEKESHPAAVSAGKPVHGRTLYL